MGGGQEGAGGSLKPFEPRPILRAELDRKLQLIAVMLLFENLAAGVQPGDALAIMDSGAYFIPFATSFSFPQPAVVMLEKGETKLLRRAESFEDLVSLDEW